jgi:hypothetical protein
MISFIGTARLPSPDTATSCTPGPTFQPGDGPPVNSRDVPEPTPTAQRRSDEAPANGVDDPAVTVARLQEEVLRLRDEVIGLEAELGAAKGRVAEMTVQIQRYESMRQRLEAILGSTSWRVMWAAGAPLRRLRRPGQ